MTWLTLSASFVLGLASALTPGPLSALLISETLQRGPRAGVPLALVPMATDPPIILFALWVLARLSSQGPALGVISLLGAVFLSYLGFANFTTRGWFPTSAGASGAAFRKGLAVNLLNPNAYLFWFMVGGPMVIAAWRQGWLPTAAFFTGFYVSLLGSNLAIVYLVGHGRQFIQGRFYVWMLRGLGVCLFVFAGLFVKKGLQALGWL